MAQSAPVNDPVAAGLRGTPLLLIAAVLALLVNDPMGWLPSAPAGVARGVTALKAVLFLAFLALNWRTSGRWLRSGLACFAVGLFANAIPSVVYGAMPYSVQSARRAGMTEAQVSSGSSGHVPVADIWWPLRPLADIVPVAGLHLVASIGDLLLLAGILLGALGLLRVRTARRNPTT